MDTIKCYKCKENKPTSDFYKNKSRENGFNGYCKQCVTNNEKKLLKEAKEWYAEWKSSQGCFKCGDKRSYVLDLHHVDNRREGNKNRLLSRIISSGTLSFENRKKKILDEAKNCVVVCSNCHREIHYFEKN
jgi:protein-arginine kinase activator protein McsA